MPSVRSSQPCHDFVNPAHLFSAFPMVYDQDLSSQPYYRYSQMDESISTGSIPQESIFDAKSAQGWKSEPSDYLIEPTQQGGRGVGTPSIGDDGSPSSVSNSPSPGVTSQQQGRSRKRRAQNRVAQRAYRDRKTRYVLDLQSGIQDIEHNIRRLQNENTELIRQLCEMRAANNDLRDANRKDSVVSNESNGIVSEPISQDGPAEAWSKANFTSPSTGDLDALYEPFAAMWNLIHLDPSVVRGTVSAQTVLQRLYAMVEFSAPQPDPRSYSTSYIPGWPSGESFSS